MTASGLARRSGNGARTAHAFGQMPPLGTAAGPTPQNKFFSGLKSSFEVSIKLFPAQHVFGLDDFHNGHGQSTPRCKQTVLYLLHTSLSSIRCCPCKISDQHTRELIEGSSRLPMASIRGGSLPMTGCVSQARITVIATG